MKKKGFTLIELLVVISIIALLMAILMPALAKVRAIAQRVVCGSHLSGIGKAMALYATEQDGKYPRAGRKYSVWGKGINDWTGGWATLGVNNEENAFGLIPASPPGNPATISSCLYLLIKYSDVSTKQLVCGGDTASIFDLSDFATNTVQNDDIMEAWDFGPPGQSVTITDMPCLTPISQTANYYSYSYHFPFGQIGMSYFPLTSLSEAGMAVMADKNPYLVSNPDPAWRNQVPPGVVGYGWEGLGGTKETEKWGNSPNHLMEGQNVLFNDGHVTFHDAPYCGVDNDNIYSKSGEEFGPTSIAANPEVGLEPWEDTYPEVVPYDRTDSLLVNEGAKCRDFDAIFKVDASQWPN